MNRPFDPEPRWEPRAYALGVEALDAEHQAMHALVGALQHGDLLDGGAGLLATLEKLREISWDHFRHEEVLMAEVHYPFRNGHARLHRDLLDRLDLMIARCREGRLKSSAPLVEFITAWATNHFQGEDQRLADYLRELRAG